MLEVNRDDLISEIKKILTTFNFTSIINLKNGTVGVYQKCSDSDCLFCRDSNITYGKICDHSTLYNFHKCIKFNKFKKYNKLFRLNPDITKYIFDFMYEFIQIYFSAFKNMALLDNMLFFEFISTRDVELFTNKIMNITYSFIDGLNVAFHGAINENIVFHDTLCDIIDRRKMTTDEKN